MMASWISLRPRAGAHALGWVLISFACCRPGPIRTPDTSTLPSAEAALAQVRARASDRDNMRASGRVTYFGEEGRIRVRTIVLAQRPSAFRVETLSPLEQPIDVMTSDGNTVWLLSKGRLRIGPATPDRIARLLPLALPPDAVVDILLGGVPASVDVTATGIVWDDDLWKVDLEALGGARGHLWVDPALTVPTRWETERIRVDFEDFDEVAGAAGPFPRRINVKIASPEADVRIRLDAPQLGASLEPGLFRIDAPPGVEPEPL